MKPFNLEEAKAGKPVCTRNGSPVRILCFDANSMYPIVALVDKGDKEIPYTYTNEGKVTKSNIPSPFDLMMSPEKKQGWLNVYKCISNENRAVTSGYVYESKKIAKDNACIDNYVGTFPFEWEE